MNYLRDQGKEVTETGVPFDVEPSCLKYFMTSENARVSICLPPVLKMSLKVLSA